jgi:hypothetical protein
VYSTGMYTGMEYGPEIIPAQTAGFYKFQYHLYTYLPTYLPHTRKKSALGPIISSIQRRGRYESVNINPILVPGWYEKYSILVPDWYVKREIPVQYWYVYTPGQFQQYGTI